jgi:predicted O-methyltransferase YrrM
MTMIVDRARRILAPALKGTGIGNLLVSAYRGSERVKLQFQRVGIAARYCVPRVTTTVSWLVRSSEVSNFVYDLTESNKLYLANGVAVALGCGVDEITAFFQEAEADQELRAHLIESKSPPFFGRRLIWYAVARKTKPKVIVESGVDRGLGSVLLCAALLRNASEGHPGRHYGLDIMPTAGDLLTGRYADTGKILFGDAIATLQDFDKPIDLFINDSDHHAEYERREYDIVRGKLSPLAIVIGDNIHVTTELAEFSRREHRRFLYLPETPKDHWYPGAATGLSFP